MKLLASALFNQASPLDTIFADRINVMNPIELEDLKPAALVIWGGEDISPKMYGQKKGRWTGGSDDHLSRRDQLEHDLFRKAIDLKILVIGVCRGAQMACAIAGGTLIQDVDGHATGGGHDMLTSEGHTIRTNSVHHQMMNPIGVEHDLLAWAHPKVGTQFLGESNKDVSLPKDFREPEVVWFPTIRALGIQGHPEFGSARPPFIRYCLEKINVYL